MWSDGHTILGMAVCSSMSRWSSWGITWKAGSREITHWFSCFKCENKLMYALFFFIILSQWNISVCAICCFLCISFFCFQNVDMIPTLTLQNMRHNKTTTSIQMQQIKSQQLNNWCPVLPVMRYVTNVAHVLSQLCTTDSSLAQTIYLRIKWLRPHTKSSPFHPTMQGNMKNDLADIYWILHKIAFYFTKWFRKLIFSRVA